MVPRQFSFPSRGSLEGLKEVPSSLSTLGFSKDLLGTLSWGVEVLIEDLFTRVLHTKLSFEPGYSAGLDYRI